MANDNLKRMLEMSKRMEQSSSANGASTFPKRTDNITLDKQLEKLDEQVFGKYQKPEGKYDPQEEMNRWKQRYEDGKGIPNIENSHLPKNIIESILSNPCNLEPIVEDPRMKALQERIDGKMPGIRSVIEVQKKLDEHDKERMELQEQLKPKSQKNEMSQITNGAIDYSLIKMIIENAIEEKMKSLNESYTHGASNNNMKAMMIVGDKFRFLDSDDNIYECQLNFIGKKRKK